MNNRCGCSVTAMAAVAAVLALAPMSATGQPGGHLGGAGRRADLESAPHAGRASGHAGILGWGARERIA